MPVDRTETEMTPQALVAPKANQCPSCNREARVLVFQACEEIRNHVKEMQRNFVVRQRSRGPLADNRWIAGTDSGVPAKPRGRQCRDDRNPTA
jgi:hypothetical protein